MKKASILLISSAIFFGCTKERSRDLPLDGFSSLNIVNVAPGAGRAATATISTPALRVVVDTSSYSTVLGGFRYNNVPAIGYLSTLAGVRNVQLFDTLGTTRRLLASVNSYNFEIGAAQSFFVYDTLSVTNPSSTLKVLKLNDNLTLPDANTANVRFLHFAPLAPAVDVTFLRTSITPNDSVTVSANTYIGNTATPNESALQNFRNIPAGTYNIRVKLAGTQTVAISATAVSLVSTGQYSFWATGTARNSPLTTGSFRHF